MGSFISDLLGTLGSLFQVGDVVLKDDSGHLRVEDENENLKRVRAASASDVDDVITTVDVGGGTPGFPALDGSLISGITVDLDDALVDDNSGNVVSDDNTGNILVGT